MSSPSFVRNQGLDILRGIAILMVLINHVEPGVLPGLPLLHGAVGGIYWRLRSFGWSGVDMFFVLSGFLISGLLFKELERTGTLALGRFWGRRAFKVIPSYAALLVVLAATGATSWLDTTSVSTVATSLVKHGLFCQNYLENNPNGPTWSLAVEEHFYLVMPCLLLLLAWKASLAQFERRVLFTGVTILVAVLVLRCVHTVQGGVDPGDFRLSHFRIDSLFLGVLVQLLARRKHPIAKAVLARPWLALAAAAVLIAPSFVLGRAHPLMFSVGFTSLGLGYALVLLVFAQGFDLRHPGALGRMLAIIGTWSYNIYLWNFFLVSLPVTQLILKQSWFVDPVQQPAMAVLLRGGVFALTAIAVGAAFTKVVEAPFLWLRDRVIPQAARPQPVDAAMPGLPVQS
jgi:peptidoglycan/LPS O-acetylase OafA/YrhL